jgi:hypothetical protein
MVVMVVVVDLGDRCLFSPTRFRWWFVALVMSDEVLVVRLTHWRWTC